MQTLTTEEEHREFGLNTVEQKTENSPLRGERELSFGKKKTSNKEMESENQTLSNV